MNNTLNTIVKRYNLNLDLPSPISVNDTREDLPRLFHELGFKVGAEIGVDRGIYAQVLCENNPGVQLFCIDPWKLYKEYADFNNQNVLNVNYHNTKKRLAPYNALVLKASSMGIVNSFADNSLDFVYIDANHAYKYVLQDCREWSKKVRPGGIVSGHDYTTRRHKNVGLDVKKAVDQFMQENNIKPFFQYTAKGNSTWFFVK